MNTSLTGKILAVCFVTTLMGYLFGQQVNSATSEFTVDHRGGASSTSTIWDGVGGRVDEGGVSSGGGVRGTKTNGRVALCLHSMRFQSLRDTGKFMMKNIVEPLDADVFAAGANLGLNGSLYVKTSFGSRIKGMLFEQQMPFNTINKFIANLPYYKKYYEGWSSNAFRTGPFMQYYWVQKAMNLVRAHELLHDFRYDWIIFSRPDMYWYAPPPPLPLMRTHSNVSVFTPDTMPSGAIQPIFVICLREACPGYTDLWENLMTGRAFDILRRVAVPTYENGGPKKKCNTETLIHAWITANHVESYSITPVAQIRCSSHKCIADHPRMCYQWNKFCPREGQVFKYDEQGRQAYKEAMTMYDEHGVANWYQAPHNKFTRVPLISCIRITPSNAPTKAPTYRDGYTHVPTARTWRVGDTLAPSPAP